MHNLMERHNIIYCHASLVVCTHLSGEVSARYVGVGRMMTSRSLGGMMLGILAWNARGVSYCPVLGAISNLYWPHNAMCLGAHGLEVRDITEQGIRGSLECSYQVMLT